MTPHCNSTRLRALYVKHTHAGRHSLLYSHLLKPYISTLISVCNSLVHLIYVYDDFCYASQRCQILISVLFRSRRCSHGRGGWGVSFAMQNYITVHNRRACTLAYYEKMPRLTCCLCCRSICKFCQRPVRPWLHVK